METVQRMLHGEPPLHITPLEEGGDDDQVVSEPAGELERGTRGPAVEIQVRYPGAELQIDIPADLAEDRSLDQDHDREQVKDQDNLFMQAKSAI